MPKLENFGIKWIGYQLNLGKKFDETFDYI